MGIKTSIDITPKQRKTLLSLLARHIPGITVWAFGSRLKWTSRPESDLDLIVFSTPQQRGRISALKEAFEESSLPLRVDVLVWDEVPNDFRKNIQKNYVVLVEKPSVKPESQTGMRSDTDSLEAMCEMIVDCPHSTPKWTGSGVIVLRNQNIKNGRLDLSDPSYTDEEHYQQRIRRAIPQAGDIVITREAPMGEVCMIPEGVKCCLGQRQVLLRPQKGVNAKYLLFALQSPAVQLEILWNEGTGSTVSNVRIPVLKNLNIPRHPDSEDEITEILSSLSDKIELNRQINQTLEQMAQAIFKSWFVDFEPVKAKIKAKEEGRDPECAAMSAISGKTDKELEILPAKQYKQLAATAALFTDELEKSELGEIPKGWNWIPFGELVERTVGGDWGKEEPDTKHTEKVRILRGTDLPNVYAGNDTSVPWRFVEAKKLSSRKLEDGDIVIEVSGGSPKQPTGRSLYVTDQILERLNYVVEPASFCRLLRPINKKVGLLLSVHLAKIYDDGKMWFYQNQSTGISNFQTKVFLANEHVVLPNNEILHAFFNLVKPIFDKMFANENGHLVKVRDSLLPKLLSGEIAVGKTGRKKEAVA